jgi:hypothetical protein
LIIIGYPEIYYQLGNIEKARATSKTLLNIFTEKLVWLSTFSEEDTNLIFEEIDTTLYMYRNVISQAEKEDKDEDYVSGLKNEFLNTVELFESLIPEDEE